MNINELKKIVDGAPDDVTVGGEPIEVLNRNMHNLDDLRTILAQHEEIERLKAERFEFTEQAVIQAVLMFGKENTTASRLGIWYREWYTQQLREQSE